METAYGYGTIYQRRSDARWIGCVDLPRQRGDKRRRKAFTGATREDVELRLAAYRADNPPREHLGSRAANMERAKSLGTHTAGEWWRLVRSVRGACSYCGVSHRDFEQDHIIPVARGGSDSIENICVACPACNTEKGTMTGDEYRAWKTARASEATHA